LSAVKQFFIDFASGESARINATTLTETIKTVLDLDSNIKLDLNVQAGQKASRKGGRGRTASPSKKGPQDADPDALGIFVTFSDFTEIIFEISQEINIKRNETPASKFKQYIEGVILVNIRYRLPMASPKRGDDASDDEVVDKKENLHKKRLIYELDRTKNSDLMREAIRAASVASDTSFIDLM
jgi:hypothetical protein